MGEKIISNYKAAKSQQTRNVKGKFEVSKEWKLKPKEKIRRAERLNSEMG